MQLENIRLKAHQVQRLAGITLDNWQRYRARGLLHMDKKQRYPKRQHSVTYDVVQACMIGLQQELFKRHKMRLELANHLAEEAGDRLREYLKSNTPTGADDLLFAVRPTPTPSTWMKITSDTRVAEIEQKLGSNWLLVDLMAHLNRIAEFVAAEFPEDFKHFVEQIERKN